MSPQDTLALSFLKKLISTRGIYIVGYGWLCGMSIWVTFFGGPIAHKALPKQQYSSLQRQSFPIYFAISLWVSSVLLVLWVFDHPGVLNQLGSPLVVDVAQVYVLTSIIWLQGVNQFVVRPMTGKVVLQRQKLEKAESSATVSEEMKALNARFGMLHGVSSLANFGAIVALIFHGLCLGMYI